VRASVRIPGNGLTCVGLPYKTEFVEYPDIAPKLKALGLAPNKDDPPYTIPAIKIGNEYFMDSAVIAEELEKRYPTPSMKLDSPRLKRVTKLIIALDESLRPVGMSHVFMDSINLVALL
jgi:glutathione S-transferase